MHKYSRKVFIHLSRLYFLNSIHQAFANSLFPKRIQIFLIECFQSIELNTPQVFLNIIIWYLQHGIFTLCNFISCLKVWNNILPASMQPVNYPPLYNYKLKEFLIIPENERTDLLGLRFFMAIPNSFLQVLIIKCTPPHLGIGFESFNE